MKSLLIIIALVVMVPRDQEDLRYTRARNQMVKSQIVARGISDPAILKAMERVPRHLFVPPALVKSAYNDQPLPIGYNQTISQPFIVAYMTELSKPATGKKALEIGVDIVLSLNSSNIGTIGTDVAKSGAAAVVIPDTKEGVDSLIRNIKAAKDAGITRIIADPVLDPIGHGIAKSIVRYQEFHEEFPRIPIFFGVGNVTELIDADSIGVNAALCGIGTDVCASILFTPEFSYKTQGSINELKTASEMMVLSKERDSSPKDLGIDLLVLKEKRRRLDTIVPENAVTAKKADMWRIDPAGCIRIGIVPDINSGTGGVIVADHKKASIVGETANSILDTLIEMGLVSTVGHAGYLGRELKKAELALKYNRSYAQDDDF